MQKYTGLSIGEVHTRVLNNDINIIADKNSRSFFVIFFSNTFTIVNLILGILFITTLVFGSGKDALFGLVIVVNILICIIQEIRVKFALDKLNILIKSKYSVFRDGELTEIDIENIVLDDVIKLQPGNQIPADGVILETLGLEVDESLLTGEAIPALKKNNDPLYSGSIIISGICIYRVIKVGKNTFAGKISNEARKFTIASSEIRDSINKILVFEVWLVVPLSIFFLFSQLENIKSFSFAVNGTVAGLVGVFPQGLVLLTSIAFIVSVIRLGKIKVLVQELSAVELLARVNVLCIDKTGTLTERDLKLEEMKYYGNEDIIDQAVSEILLLSDNLNPIFHELGKDFNNPSLWQVLMSVPFSSERKWSSFEFKENGTWVLCASDIIANKMSSLDRELLHIKEATEKGQRVLCLASSNTKIENSLLPTDLKLEAVFIFEQKIRENVKQTLEYFIKQGIEIKVISGDNLMTVIDIVNKSGITTTGTPTDLSLLSEDNMNLNNLLTSNVFARATPKQKEEIINILKKQGKVVAMLGDGLNDILALKSADLGIAMGSGSQATKSVAQIILADDDFNHLPIVTAEGRRVMSNIENVAALFLTKTIYFFSIIFFVILFDLSFPLLPRDSTIIGVITMTIPAFLLTFSKNYNVYSLGFMRRVLKISIPAGLTIATMVSIIFYLNYFTVLDIEKIRTLTTLTISILGLWFASIVLRPITAVRLGLILSLAVLLLLLFTLPLSIHFFNFYNIQLQDLVNISLPVFVGISLLEAFNFRKRN